MLEKFISRIFDVYVEFPNSVEYYVFSIKRKRFNLLSRQELPKENISSAKKPYISKFVESLDIKKIDVPTAVSGKLLESIVKKELGESFQNHTVRYSITTKDKDFKNINIYYFNREDFQTYMQMYNNIYVFTYIPFSLLSFSREFTGKKVMQVHVHKHYIFIIYSLDNSLEFFRIAKVSNVDEIYENIVLTHRYIYTSVGNIDLILISSKIDYDDNWLDRLYNSVKVPIAKINPYFYFEPQPDKEAFKLLDYIIPVGTIKINHEYNFLPEEVQIDKNFHSMLKLSSVITAFVSIFVFINALDIISNLFDKYISIQTKSLTLNKSIFSLIEKIKDKDVDGVIIKNKLDEEISLQNKSLNKLLEYRDILSKENYKLEIQKTEKGYMTKISYTNRYKSVKELENTYDSLKNKATVKKDFKDMSLEVSITYETTNN